VPSLIKTFIKQCWDASPDKRPVLSDVLKLKPWDSWVREQNYLVKGDGAKVWDAAKGKATLPWGTFIKAFTSEFRSVKDEIAIQSMRVLMEVTFDTDDAVVKKENYDNFLKWFGPISGATVVDVFNFLPALLDSAKSPWFHGCINSDTARHRLKKKGPNTYLVRLSTWNEDKAKDFPFILSYRQGDSTHHTGFNFKFSEPIKTQLDNVLAARKVATFTHCAEGRDTLRFDLAFSKPGTRAASGVAHGKGYVTDYKPLEGLSDD